MFLRLFILKSMFLQLCSVALKFTVAELRAWS